MAKAKWKEKEWEPKTRKQIGRHKKRMNKDEKRSYKKNRGQGR
jgi:hypothetical protein